MRKGVAEPLQVRASAWASSNRASASCSRSPAVLEQGDGLRQGIERLAGSLAAELDRADQEPVVAFEPPVLAPGVEGDGRRPGLDRGVEVAEPLLATADRTRGVGFVAKIAECGPRGPLGPVKRQGGREFALLDQPVGLGGLTPRLGLDPRGRGPTAERVPGA